MSCSSKIPSEPNVTSFVTKLVKFYAPENIILDITSETEDLEKELEEAVKVEGQINKYWSKYESRPIQVILLEIGELVSVKIMGTWKAALVAEPLLIDGEHFYEVVLISTGALTVVHKTDIRDIVFQKNLPRRYVSFSLAGMKSSNKLSVSRCNDLRMLFMLASKITIGSIATKAMDNSLTAIRLCGNAYIHVSNYVVDVKEWFSTKKVSSREAYVPAHPCDLSLEDQIHNSTIKPAQKTNVPSQDKPIAAHHGTIKKVPIQRRELEEEDMGNVKHENSIGSKSARPTDRIVKWLNQEKEIGFVLPVSKMQTTGAKISYSGHNEMQGEASHSYSTQQEFDKRPFILQEARDDKTCEDNEEDDDDDDDDDDDEDEEVENFRTLGELQRRELQDDMKERVENFRTVGERQGRELKVEMKDEIKPPSVDVQDFDNSVCQELSSDILMSFLA